MAITKTIEGSTVIKNNSQLTARYGLTVTQGTQSIEENETSTSYSYYFTYDTASVQFVGTTRPKAGYLKVIINGTEVGNHTLPLTNGITDGTVIASGSGTIDVTHDDSGSKTLSFSIAVSSGTDQKSYNYVWNDSSKSDTLILTSIPRAGEITSVTGTYLGSAVTVNVDRKSTSFTHKVEYSFAGSGWITGVANSDGSDSFTPALSLASNIPSSSSGTLTVRLTTLSENTQVGSTDTKTITLKLPDAHVPTLSSLSLSRVDNGVPSSWGVYVKGYSKVKATINGASGVYGSTIKGYSISGAGFSSSSSSFTTGILNTADTFTFTAKVTDSRSRTSAEKNESITVVDYFMPSISVTAKRCTQDGTLSSSGTYLSVVCTYKFASVSGKNSATVTISCNGVTATVGTSGSTTILNANCLASNIYTLTATITDGLSNSASAEIKIPTDTRVWNAKRNGKGFAVGGFAKEDGVFKSYWDIKDKTGALINKADIINFIYPVGSIYISVNSTSPSTLFGGTWEKMSGGFLYGATSSVGNSSITGTSTGSYSGTSGSTALTIDQIPAHSHNYAQLNGRVVSDGSSWQLQGLNGDNETRSTSSVGGSEGHTHSIPSHSHAVSYMAVWVWKRTA